MVNHNNVRKNILELVKYFPGVILSYNSLLYHYWTFFDGVRGTSDISNSTPAETINRNFRKLVESGMIVIPEDLKRKRKEAQKQYKNDFAKL